MLRAEFGNRFKCHPAACSNHCRSEACSLGETCGHQLYICLAKKVRLRKALPIFVFFFYSLCFMIRNTHLFVSVPDSELFNCGHPSVPISGSAGETRAAARVAISATHMYTRYTFWLDALINAERGNPAANPGLSKRLSQG